MNQRDRYGEQRHPSDQAGGESSGHTRPSDLYGEYRADRPPGPGYGQARERQAPGYGARYGGYAPAPEGPGGYPGGAARFQQGPYYGRGPRSYRRSDERIAEDLNERLTDDPYVDAGDVTVRVSDGVATLEGTVPERWMRYRVEDIADGCGGVKEVDNHLRVPRRSGGAA